MNELERAATALRDRPVAAPAPLDAIERRAGGLRRRRRLVEVGAVALVALVLGTAAFALSGAHHDRDDQGVFVGQGSGPLPGSTVSTYHLASLLDADTLTDLQMTLDNRFFSADIRGASVVIEGTTVTVTSSAPQDTVDALVTSPGGFELRPVQGEVEAARCGSEGSPRGDAMWTSGSAGPERCLGLLPALALPAKPTTAAGNEGRPGGDGYQLDVVLTAEASQAVVDQWDRCQPVDHGTCPLRPIGVVAAGTIVDPAATVFVTGSDGLGVQLRFGNVADERTASYQTSLLSLPLPAGVTFASHTADPTTATTTSSTGETTATNVAGSPFSSSGTSVWPICLKSPVVDDVLAASAAALSARFAAIGRTVDVSPVSQNDVEPYVPCDSGQALVVSSSYDPADADWVRDQTAVALAGELRHPMTNSVLHPTAAIAGSASTDGRPTLTIDLPTGEIDGIDAAAATVQCLTSAPCWLTVTIDGEIPTDDVAISSDRTSLVLTLGVGQDGYAARLSAVLSHPLPVGVVLN